MDMSKPSCLGSLLRGMPLNRAFSSLFILVILINFKFYLGHLSMDNGNNPNENKYEQEFGGGGSCKCEHML